MEIQSEALQKIRRQQYAAAKIAYESILNNLPELEQEYRLVLEALEVQYWEQWYKEWKEENKNFPTLPPSILAINPEVIEKEPVVENLKSNVDFIINTVPVREFAKKFYRLKESEHKLTPIEKKELARMQEFAKSEYPWLDYLD